VKDGSCDMYREKRNAFRILVGKPEAKKLLEKTRHK
jgi:hypothetical protein